MKHILFVIPSFAIGGVTSSLSSLLSILDYNKTKVDIFCRQKVGPMMDAYPNCTFLPENVFLSTDIIEGDWKKKLLFRFLRIIRVLFRKVGADLNKMYGKIGGNRLKTMQYDAVISFHEGLSPIVCFYPAKKHIAWIHCDYSRYQSIIGKDELKYYSLYDNIVCVSDFAKSVFCRIYPSLSNKVSAIHNIINVDTIRMKAKDNTELDSRFDTSQYTIVSVGRLDPVKQFDRIPEVAFKLKALTSQPFKWYIIGGSRGFDQEEVAIAQSIQKYHLENEVTLLGEKTNVYPYIAKSNLYVCTSESESFPLAINEAKALDVPIISNNFPSAMESINNNIDGEIISIDQMPEVIARMMDAPKKLSFSYIDNQTPLNQFYQLIELKNLPLT